jgi:hypothetical protein
MRYFTYEYQHCIQITIAPVYHGVVKFAGHFFIFSPKFRTDVLCFLLNNCRGLEEVNDNLEKIDHTGTHAFNFYSQITPQRAMRTHAYCFFSSGSIVGWLEGGMTVEKKKGKQTTNGLRPVTYLSSYLN